MSEDGRRQSDADALLPVSIGTAAWLLVLVALVIAKPALDDHGTSWWIAAAAVGAVSGLGGIVFLRWRKGRGRARPAD